MRRERFAPRGQLALEPSAFGMIFFMDPPPENETRDGVAIVKARGPLMHHAGWWDSYDALKDRFAAALEGSPKAIILCLDSPGGVVSGCFETARELRAMAKDAGVDLYAYVDGHATSAAYALACAADTIGVPETGCVGSIGVIDALVDATAQDAMCGLSVSLVASGERKTDGNPHMPTSDSAVAAAQKRVNGLAEMFFGLVADARGIGVDQVRALEAGLLYGEGAVEAGLADQVMTFQQMLAVAGGAEETDMSAQATKDYEDAIAKLRKAAEGDDEEEARKAKKMLAAMDEDDESAEDDDEPGAEGDDKDEETSASTSAEDDEKKDESESKSTKAGDDDEKEDANALAFKAMREVQAMRAERAAEKEAAERKELLASRPDFAPDVVKFLATASIKQVREAVKTFPRGPVKLDGANRAAATATVAGTRGEGQGDGSSAGLPADEADALAVQMGVKRDPAKAIRRDRNRLVLGVMTPADARAYEEAKKDQGASAR